MSKAVCVLGVLGLVAVGLSRLDFSQPKSWQNIRETEAPAEQDENETIVRVPLSDGVVTSPVQGSGFHLSLPPATMGPLATQLVSAAEPPIPQSAPEGAPVAIDAPQLNFNGSTVSLFPLVFSLSPEPGTTFFRTIDGHAMKPRRSASIANITYEDHTRFVNTLPLGSRITLPAGTSLTGRALKIVFAILTAPEMFHQRLIPLLETSLRHETSIAFFDANHSSAETAAATLRLYAAKTGRRVSAVVLPNLPNMKMSLRNAWVDLPALKAMSNAYGRTVDWFAIVDDDTYVLSAATREILSNYTVRIQPKNVSQSTGMHLPDGSEPLVVADLLTWGAGGGWRIVRRNGKVNLVETTKRVPVTFPCGGSGIFVSSAAAEAILPDIDRCIEKHLHPAGDIRLGNCLAEHSVPLVRRREFVKDTPFRAVGELRLPHQFAFPASFHRLRTADWYHQLGQLEAKRGRWGLVPWADVEAAFQPGFRFVRSLFFPKEYPNASKVLGERPTHKPYPCKALKRHGLTCPPPRGNPQADEW